VEAEASLCGKRCPLPATIQDGQNSKANGVLMMIRRNDTAGDMVQHARRSKLSSHREGTLGLALPSYFNQLEMIIIAYKERRFPPVFGELLLHSEKRPLSLESR
jgi:hypothetical protein